MTTVSTPMTVMVTRGFIATPLGWGVLLARPTSGRTGNGRERVRVAPLDECVSEPSGRRQRRVQPGQIVVRHAGVEMMLEVVADVVRVQEERRQRVARDHRPRVSQRAG